jgi:uncharacterized protein (TIGR03437 family)
MRPTLPVTAALLLTVASLAAAQTWDSSGNALLKGTWCFRQVVWQVGDSSGNLNREISISGNINFDGISTYTLTNLHTADTASPPVNASTSGTFSIAASGYGFLSSPLFSGDQINGLVAQGIFIGSSTENHTGYHDLFIAAQLGTPVFQGSYTLADLDFPTASIFDARDSLLQLNPDGTANANGYVTATGLAPLSQYFSGLTYSVTNGVGAIDFGGALAPSNLISGPKALYFSPDGNFVFGGSLTGWDLIVGVRAATTLPKFSGLYYQAGLDEDNSQVQPATAQHPASGSATLDTYYGALNALPGGQLLGHRRVLTGSTASPAHSTYAASYSINSTGTDDSSDQEHFFFGAGGSIRIGLGNNPLLGISVALHAPALTGSAPFIDPTQITNAASSAPFTAGIAPGELITLYGTGLATQTQYDPTFPTLLAGVQVTVNNRPARLIFVSPTQISALVPFATAESIASILVMSNKAASNTVTTFVNRTAPGVYTVPSGGLGYAAALHGDYSLVTPASPAQPGEVIQVFVTGLGAVSPAVGDAAPGPVNPFSSAVNAITASIGGQPATVQFDGLAPQLSGLYQVNVQVPAGLSDGSVYLSLGGPDSTTAESLLPVASAASQ